MKSQFVASAALLLAALSSQANASTFTFSFAGPQVSGLVTLTYGTTTDANYPQAFEVTGISGTFSDLNANIVNAPIDTLVPINYAAPEASNLLAPHDFSKFAVAANLPSANNGDLTYDNLFYPGGSPQTASSYPTSGGFLDIYGLLFDIGGGRVVNFWSNGYGGNSAVDYGLAVATSSVSLDYVSPGVSVSPEPSEMVLLGSGLVGLLIWRRKAARKTL